MSIIEIESLTNKTMMVTYDSPSVHFEKACLNEDMRTTVSDVVELALDHALA